MLEPGMTVYLRPVGNGAFPAGSDTPVKLDQIESAMTICAVEADADRAVPWTKPADLPFDPANPRAGLGNLRLGGFAAVMGDGMTQVIGDDVDDAALASMFTLDPDDNHAP